MKATLIKTDGTRVELEGTPNEIKTALAVEATLPICLLNHCPLQHYPNQTQWNWPIWWGTQVVTNGSELAQNV